MRYYDFRKHWTKRVMPHLGDKKLNEILVRDFNKFTFGRWGDRFEPGQFPRDFESCDWSWESRGPEPRFWRYVKHSACHWLVNFNLRLAMLSEPKRVWRIITSDKHSSVWDGEDTLFDMNFSALGVPADEGFSLAYDQELKPGKYLKTYLVPRWQDDVT